MYLTRDLTKSEKKNARIIIEKGLQFEYEKSIVQLDEIISRWKDKKIDNREAYMALYDKMISRDKHIARRYDRMSGSHYLYIIIEQLRDGVIAENDLDVFPAELKEVLLKVNSSISLES
jgi:hypothetical protein